MKTLVLLAAGVLAQTVFLPCLCARGTVKMQIAGILDTLILLRIVVGIIVAEGGRGWLFYAILPFALIPLLFAAEELYDTHPWTSPFPQLQAWLWRWM